MGKCLDLLQNFTHSPSSEAISTPWLFPCILDNSITILTMDVKVYLSHQVLSFKGETPSQSTFISFIQYYPSYSRHLRNI